MDLSNYNRPKLEKSGGARNAREDLIVQIVQRTDANTEAKKRALARRIALAANILQWSDFDLSVLLAKSDHRKYPGIRNYSPLVMASIKITAPKNGPRVSSP